MADEVIARYPLRTPRGYVAVLWAMIAVGIAAGVMLCAWLTTPYHGAGGMLGALLALLAALPVWYALTTRAYRIRGGRGELALYADRVELRDGRGGSVVFPAASLLAVATPMVVKIRAWGLIPLGERRAGTLVALRSGRQHVTLSTKLFEDEEWEAGLLEDVALLRAGERPRGPRRPEPPPRPVSVSPHGYDYEAELDRELRRYDES